MRGVTRPPVTEPQAGAETPAAPVPSRREGARPGAGRGAAPDAVAAALLYLGATAWYLRPIWRVFATDIAPDPYDPVFVLYLMKWGVRQLRAGLPNFWDAPFFFPTPHVVALSDHVFGAGVFAAAMSVLTPNPLVAYNTLLLSCFAASGLAVWWVLRRTGVAFLPALAGGLIYAFSPFRWSQLSHLQVLLAAFIPLVLWTWYRLLAAPTWRRAAAFLGCYLVHLSGGLYLAYMIHVALAALAANRLLWPPRRTAAAPGDSPGDASGGASTPPALPLWRQALILATVAVVAGGALVTLFRPYRQISRVIDMVWSADVLRVWGTTVLSFLTPSPTSRYSSWWPLALYRSENSLFAGFLPSVLAAAGLIWTWRRLRPRHRRAPGAPTPGVPPPLWARVALAALLGAGIAGFLLGEIYTWGRDVPQLAGVVPGDGYPLAWRLCAAGIAGWLLLYRRVHGAWPIMLRPLEPWQRGLLLAGAACTALSFPMVFNAARAVLPGLAAMRVPSRFYAFISLALADVAARQLERWLDAARCWQRGRIRRMGHVGRRWRLLPATLGGLAVALLLIELAPRPVAWEELPAEKDFDPVYHWLRDQPSVQALLELPLADTDLRIPELVNVSYLYYGTLHWKPLVNGYSAHWPGDHAQLSLECCSPVPDGDWLERLRSWGVTHLLVHRDDLSPWEQRALDAWETTGVAQRVYADAGGDRVYRLLPAPTPTTPAPQAIRPAPIRPAPRAAVR